MFVTLKKQEKPLVAEFWPLSPNDLLRCLYGCVGSVMGLNRPKSRIFSDLPVLLSGSLNQGGFAAICSHIDARLESP